jgi:ADP-ribosylglycohydrolase
LRSGLSWLIPAFLVVCSFGAPAGAQRTITADELLDRMRGMWLGQLIGNAAGRQSEGKYSGSEPDPNESVPWRIQQVWDADDDTDIEYVALHILQTNGFDCNSYEITAQWLDHVTETGIYMAGKQAWRLMRDGHLPPETSSRTYNEHWYAIDAQIGTESLGAVSPGMPKAAVELAGRFARVTNDGFAVHAAQFYAAMYASAFFEPNVVELVRKGLASIPPGSRTAQVIRDVLDWYTADLSDGNLDWRATRHQLYDKYQGAGSFGRYYNWAESTINAGATVLAFLYGGGDFKRTVQIAVLAGWDCDCNPATAGGLLGIIHGFDGLPADLTDPAICGDVYRNVSRPGLPNPAAQLPQSTTITDIALTIRALAEENIIRTGGSINSDGSTSLYSIPEPNAATDNIDRADINGLCGLAAQAMAAGIAVTPHASVEHHDHSRDRYNLDSITDGVTDNSVNGHKPYSTYTADLVGRPQKDWYELAFSRPVRFTGVTFYEGDVIWNKINEYYADDDALGGYFEDLAVQVLRNGTYVEPAGVQMSPGLDRFQMYQTITFTFEPVLGDAVRIIGTPGGSKRFTTILELEARGELYNGPRVNTLIIGDGAPPLVNVSTILIRFSDPVAITAADIELVGGPTVIDMQDVMLLQNSSRQDVLLALPAVLPTGAYELRLHCPAIIDDFGLPLIDDDDNPVDTLRTAAFEVASLRLDGAGDVLRDHLGDRGQREIARVAEGQVQRP